MKSGARVALAAVLCLTAALHGADARATVAEATTPGWRRHDLPSGSHCWRYRPASLIGAARAPVVVFLHGAGSSASAWRPFLTDAAEAQAAIVVAVKSRGGSWAVGVDEVTIAESLAAVAAEFEAASEAGIDWGRVAFAGHSAGGAFAYLTAFADPPPVEPSALTLWAASFYRVEALPDPALRPSIEMVYGTLDPNFLFALPPLEAQWTRLGVPFETRLLPGAGHTSVPSDVTRALVEVTAPRHPTAGACRPDDFTACAAAGRLAVRLEIVAPPGLPTLPTPLPRVRFTAAESILFSSAVAGGGDEWLALVRVEDRCADDDRIGVGVSSAAQQVVRLRLLEVSSGREATFEVAPGSAARFAPEAFLGCSPP